MRAPTAAVRSYLRRVVSERLDAYHLGYVLGPRVNAGGRVGGADLGARLLATDDPGLAAELAQRLDGYNRERREIERATLEAAIELVERQNAESPVLVFAAAEGWHPGVIGIVAARLRERYERPACVVALADGIGRGSGRSIPGLALGSAVIAARQAGLLINGGGHAMAAGFTVETTRLGALRDFLAERAGTVLGSELLVPELRIDGMLAPGAATPGLLDLVERLGPFGTGNAEPRFALANLRVVKADVAAGQHVRCVLADGAGKARVKAVAFRSLESELGPALLNGQGRAFHVAGHLRPDNWQGREDVQAYKAEQGQG